MSKDDRDKYRGDVWYEEYRRGLPEASLSDERIDDGYYSGQSAEAIVNHEVQRRQESQLEQRRAEEYEEQLREEDYEDDFE